MDAQAFAYWLQGFVEMNGGKQPTPEQWKMITEHLQLVFTKVTPKLGEPKPHTPNWDIPQTVPYFPPVDPNWSQPPYPPGIPGIPTIYC